MAKHGSWAHVIGKRHSLRNTCPRDKVCQHHSACQLNITYAQVCACWFKLGR